MIEYGGRPSFYFYSKFTDNAFNWMGEEDCKCDTDEELKDSVSKIKKAYNEYQKLSFLHATYMEKHESIADGIYEITYSDNTVIRVDYNKESYEIVKNEP